MHLSTFRIIGCRLGLSGRRSARQEPAKAREGGGQGPLGETYRVTQREMSLRRVIKNWVASVVAGTALQKPAMAIVEAVYIPILIYKQPLRSTLALSSIQLFKDLYGLCTSRKVRFS